MDRRIRARAPLRLGLAGGGTDVSPYCDLHGGQVLNATIDRYAYATIDLGSAIAAGSVRLEATDQQESVEFAPGDMPELDGRLNLHKAVYAEMMRHHHAGLPLALSLTTFCDAPVGSGLGSSSTLVVAMLRAFSELLNLALDDYAIATLAHKIERVDCGLAGGKQDQYSATFGGFNFMEFHSGGRALVNPLRIKPWILSELEASLLLVYTGASRESARIIDDQSRNVRDGSTVAIEAMHGLKREAQVMKECLLKGDFDGMVACMRLGWESKKRSARTVSNPRIDALFDAAMAAGAAAGKVSGAGGGGFMMFFAPPQHRMAVVRALEQLETRVGNVHFTKSGAQAWRVQ
jgi:D-glycero-alpha-D-manno-heptose-7-phosphate kinase